MTNTTTMIDHTAQVDYLPMANDYTTLDGIPLDTRGYERPCRANGYQSNRPSAYEISLAYTTTSLLEGYRVNARTELTKASGKKEIDRALNKVNTIERFLDMRG
jgi:hypothetical protein